MNIIQIVTVVTLIISASVNIFQWRGQQGLDMKAQELNERVIVAEQRNKLYRLRQNDEHEHFRKLKEVTRRAREYSEELSEVRALDLQAECRSLEAARGNLIKVIQDRDRNFKKIDPDYRTKSSDKDLEYIGVPGCLYRVEVVLREKLGKLMNTPGEGLQIEEQIEKLFRFASAIRDEWTKIETLESSNLRANPWQESDRVFAVPPGTSLQVLAYMRGRAWIKVLDPKTGNKGWVYETQLLVPPSALRPL